jgi:hypothetical protein
VNGHVLQNVSRRLKRLLTNLVYAHCVAAIFTCHKRPACHVSGRCVHALKLHDHWWAVLRALVQRPRTPGRRRVSVLIQQILPILPRREPDGRRHSASALNRHADVRSLL